MWPVGFLYRLTSVDLFCACILELCSTKVESFVLIELSCSVDFALQFGKAWKRIFIGREFCNTFVLIRQWSLFVCEESSTNQSELSFRPTVYKLQAHSRLFLEPE